MDPFDALKALEQRLRNLKCHDTCDKASHCCPIYDEAADFIARVVALCREEQHKGACWTATEGPCSRILFFIDDILRLVPTEEKKT